MSEPAWRSHLTFWPSHCELLYAFYFGILRIIINIPHFTPLTLHDHLHNTLYELGRRLRMASGRHG